MSEPPPKRVVLLTAMDFWRLGGGAFVRDIALVWHLGQETELTVIYIGSSIAPSNEAFAALGLPARFLSISDGPQTTRETKAERLRRYFVDHNAEVCLFDRVEPAYLLDVLPAGTRTMLDTHDVPGDAMDGLTTDADREQGKRDWERSLPTYRRFDRVVAIQARDHRRLSAALGRERVLLAPHPATLPAVARRSIARRIGLVASDWVYNVESLVWFINEVWPALGDLDVELHLYGRISKFVDAHQLSNVFAHGFVLDLPSIYRQIDIVINPIRRGSGLKIKTIEAIASGLPLVTTSEGARGVESLAGACFLVADQPRAFADAIRRLVRDEALRARLSETAAAHARRYMSPEICLGPLIDEVLA